MDLYLLYYIISVFTIKLYSSSNVTILKTMTLKALLMGFEPISLLNIKEGF